ncbi:prepilin-type N-terminal cleavage/methylation domain-containing protein [Candidatus Peregrinibacteria bacterium]|nr:prepilin-type N-terminal cleavage/methylation domain-containing protein [Candidatus Peregrinibacteria bacterium]
MIKTKSNKKGFSLVELIVAIAMFVILASGLVVFAISNYMSSYENQERLQAYAMLSETWEALRDIRNNDWEDITNGAHGLNNLNGYWEFSGSSDELNGIIRQVTISDAKRDVNGNIVQYGGEIDPDSKLMSVRIYWDIYENDTQELSFDSYIHNYKNPSIWPPEVPEEE